MSKRNKFITVRVSPSEEEKLDSIIHFLNDILKEVINKEGYIDNNITEITRSQFVRGFTNWIVDCGYIDREMWVEYCCRYVGESLKRPEVIWV